MLTLPRSLTALGCSLVVSAAVTALTVPAQAVPCRGLDCSLDGGGSSGGGGGGGGSGGGGGGTGEPPLLPSGPGGGIIVPVNPNNPAAPPIDTATLAEWARSRAVPNLPSISIKPKGRTVVRLRTDLAVTGFDVIHTQPIGPIDGQTVQATATPDHVVWNLGEIHDYPCKADHCSYTYKRSSARAPDGRYEITARILWTVSWTCEGPGCESAGDTFQDPLESPVSQPVPLIVDEIQTGNGTGGG